MATSALPLAELDAALRRLFTAQCAIGDVGNSTQLSSTKFVKLLRDANAFDKRLSKTDAELIFVNTGDDLIDTMNDEGSPGELFQAARANATFREVFNERAHLHLDEGGELHPDQIIPRWSAIAEEVKPYVSAESARWGDHWRDDRGDPDGQRYSLDHWEEENERITTFYLVKRHGKFIQHLIDADLYLE